ncbi:hypothetical protein COCOBI_10-0420 [Coccomyxa sp. Obi]|nr:hypothetical protein COCOBI_10-0420 [Coccomyxa sp. Obi]
MKPCYRCQDEFYLLAHVLKEGSHFQQPCKALISPGNCPAVTRATGEFMRRCGWLASEAPPLEHSIEIAIGDRTGSTQSTDQLVFCTLVVGSCQLSTVLHVVQDVDFLDDSMLSKWHIHIGRNDFEALQRDGRDSDICYLSVDPDPGQPGSPPNCPLGCGNFTAALSNGHPQCLSHWHAVKFMNTVNFMHRRGGQTSHSDRGPYYCSDAASMMTAEALLYLHDVVGTPWDASTCAAAARAGSVDCLSYAHASGCPRYFETCALAAGHGKLDCPVYAHEYECELNSLVLHHAARGGHLECLKYAHTHGCPFSAVYPDSLFFPPGPSICLTTHAVYASSIPCLVYVREALGCAWDTEGSECKMAFQRGDFVMLRYIHVHGSIFLTRFEWLCPGPNLWLNAEGIDAVGKANCLLYVYSYGGCIVKDVWHTRVGKLAVKFFKARRVAVLLSLHAVSRARVGGPLIAAAHAAMQRMPSDVVREVISAAGLRVLE